MTALATRIVDVGQLVQVVEVALVSGIGIGLAFSLVIRSAVRAGEHGRERPVLAGAHALMAVAGVLVVAAAIGFGISTMLSK